MRPTERPPRSVTAARRAGAQRPGVTRADAVGATWRVPYVRLCAATDTTAVLMGVVAAFVLRGLFPDGKVLGLDYLLVCVAVAVAWMVVLVLRGAYDQHRVGRGSEEFRYLADASLGLFLIVATTSYLLKAELSRGLLLVALPLGLLLLVLGRLLARGVLHRQQRLGRWRQRALVIGTPARRSDLVAALMPQAGFHVVGVLGPPPASPHGLERWLDEVVRRLASDRADTVAVASCPRISPEVVRRLSWRLEDPRTDLLVTPSLGDVAGPRMSVRPAAGLPMLQLDEPVLSGPRAALKRALDVVGALVLLVLLAPLLVVCALAIVLTSRGGVFYVADRVGRRGRTFRMIKFRSMRRGADQEWAEHVGPRHADSTERYRRDPRITRAGHVLRRWSVDELPQLVNVLGGSMSLVGPRPMLPQELPLLADADHGRHLTKPGMTGLWQVSGRKEVDWDERMRLDLDYVENWSPVLDLVILVKTVRVVLTGHGAM